MQENVWVVKGQNPKSRKFWFNRGGGKRAITSGVLLKRKKRKEKRKGKGFLNHEPRKHSEQSKE